MANRIDFQRASERGVRELTRAEVEAIAGPNADRLIERANAIQTSESTEALAAARLADRAIDVERRESVAVGLGPASQKDLRTERAIMANALASAARKAREAKAATEAVRSLARHPGDRLPAAHTQADALAGLRAEQEKVIREIETSEAAESLSQKGQQANSGRNLRP